MSLPEDYARLASELKKLAKLLEVWTMKLKKLIGMLAVVILAIPGIATATNGYFAHGYGMKAKGMGGAATAMASDAMGGANNPASMVWVGDRLDIGIDWFRPIRSAKREGSIGSANDFSQQSDSNNFFISEFGYNKMLNNDLSLGVTVSGNGMNTDYAGGTNTPAACTGGVNPSTAPVLNGLCGSGKLGVSIEQVVIAPTLAYKIDSNNTIGVAPLLVDGGLNPIKSGVRGRRWNVMRCLSWW